MSNLLRDLDTGSTMEQSAKPEAQRTIGEKLIDWLEFKYATIAGGKHILVKKLEVNLIGSLSVPQYVAYHQGNSPIVRTEYYELEAIGLVSYRSLHMVLRVGKQVLPLVPWIIPGMIGPLMLQ